MPDWPTITAWAVGIASVVGAVLGTLWVTISRVVKVAATAPAPAEVIKTTVMTTDSVAMQTLAGSVEANTTVTIQLIGQLTEVIAVGKDFTTMIRKEREEAEFNEAVEARVKEQLPGRVQEQLDLERATRRRATRRKPTPGQ